MLNKLRLSEISTGFLDPTAGQLLSFGSPEEAFITLQQHTQSKYYSDDTIYPANLQGNLHIDPSQAPIVGPWEGSRDEGGSLSCIVFLSCTKQYVYASDGRKLAAIDPFGHLYIDDVIALEQFTELAPVTIQYSASFLAYFHDNVAPVFKNRLTVNVTPPRAGIVMSAPEGIDCADGSNPTIDKSCEKLFKTASQVVLIATPDANGAFPTWTGCNTPADAETASAACTVEMTTGRAVEATYKPKCPPDPPWYKYILVPPDITGTHHYICYPIPNPPPGVMCCPPEGVPPVIELN